RRSIIRDRSVLRSGSGGCRSSELLTGVGRTLTEATDGAVAPFEISARYYSRLLAAMVRFTWDHDHPRRSFGSGSSSASSKNESDFSTFHALSPRYFC